MRKNIMLLVLIGISMVVVYGKTFQFGVAANAFQPADADYKTYYGEMIVFPEVKLGIKILKFFHICGTFGYIQANGTIAEINESTQSSQQVINMVGEFDFKLSRLIHLKLGGGGVYYMYSEKAMNMEVSSSKFGYTAGGGLSFHFSKLLFMDVFANYSQAKDVVNEVDVTLGGMSGGIRLGIKF